MKVRVRGVVYGSVKEVAEKFGVSPGNVYAMISRGREDRIGIGQGKHGGDRVGMAKPVKIGPLTFPSMYAVSRYIGKTPKYTANMIQKGKLETVVAHVMRVHASQERTEKEEKDG